MLKKKYNLLIISIFFFLIIFFSSTKCLAQEEQKTFFFNTELQAIFKRNYYLIDEKNNQKYTIKMEEFSSVEVDFIQDFKYSSEIESPLNCQEKIENFEICDLSHTYFKNFQKRKIGRIILSQEKIIDFLNKIAEKINAEPVNGEIEVEETGKIRILSLSQTGNRLDIDTTLNRIKETLLNNLENENISLVIEEIEPEITTEDVSKMGILEKIGQGESNFAGSPNNRIHNIHVGVSKFHGLILEKDEEFSFVKYLGEVDEKTGYRPELVIKDNETIPEFGGGLCQISTTLFRAALNTGLKITERKNHAYPVQYYEPQGTDATIYIPRPDLKFINNYPGKILIQGKIKGTKLIFTFYGAKDGREIQIDGPTVTKRTPEKQMYVELYQKVKNKNGELIIDDTFKSFYDNPAKYHHEAEGIITEKPKNWSKREWEEYQKSN